ncbi:hypothetical protein BUY89_12645, partial [Staphylococcus equorum]|uniref:hypothetical protein n=1 Tax=Staphylococcus equorum TaxID=246432 RepID=UPI000D4D2C16
FYEFNNERKIINEKKLDNNHELGIQKQSRKLVFFGAILFILSAVFFCDFYNFIIKYKRQQKFQVFILEHKQTICYKSIWFFFMSNFFIMRH